MTNSPVLPTHFEAMYDDSTYSMEIEKILHFIKKGDSAQVVGLPGVGRSNLMRFLAYNHNARVKHLDKNYKWFHFVYMDLSEIKGRNLAELTKFILITLSYSLSERRMQQEQEKIQSYLAEVVSFSDELVLFQALKKSIDYLSLEKELTVVLLFDRFDSFLPQVSAEFFTNLRVLRNRVKYRFSCILSLERPIEEILEPEIYKEFYEFITGNHIYLPLGEKDSDMFRFSYIEKVSGKNANPETKDTILKLSGLHGKLSRICFESVLACDSPPHNLEEFLLSQAHVKGCLFEIWSALSPTEQKQLLLSSYSEITSESYLEKSGLLKNNKIQIPLLEQFMKTLPKLSAQKITYDAQTNEILKGSDSLSDKLSPSEFKLLRYLIQNNNRICEKEEIINAVWSDEKTREGVSDQALDQIIYRLRRKLEEDPNAPTHIQTVKGRGYKFSE